MNEVNHRQMNYKTQSLQFGRKNFEEKSGENSVRSLLQTYTKSQNFSVI